MNDPLGAADPFETISRREWILTALADRDGPVPKGTLAELGDVSRSTVDRTIRECAAHGFVDRRDGGYALTVAGRLALAETIRSRETVSSIDSASAILEHVPTDAPISRALFDGASVHRAADRVDVPETTDHAELTDLIVDRIRAADRVRGFTPVEPNPRIRNVFHDVTVDGDVDCEITITGELATFLLGSHADQLSRMVTDGTMTLRQAETLPYGLGIYETGDAALVHLFPYDGAARLAGVLENDAPGAVAWANAVYRRYRERATPLLERE